MKYLIGNINNIPESITPDTIIYVEDGSIGKAQWDHLAGSGQLISTVCPFESLVSRYGLSDQREKIHIISYFLTNPPHYIQLKIDQYKRGWVGEAGNFIRDVCRVLDTIKS